METRQTAVVVHRIALGSIVRDTITGFAGVATGRTEWLHGCERYCIEPQELREGKPIEAQWFDVDRLEVLVDKDAPVKTTGGPQRDPAISRSAR